MGIEPTAHRLTAGRSTTELHSNIAAGKKGNNNPAALHKRKAICRKNNVKTVSIVQQPLSLRFQTSYLRSVWYIDLCVSSPAFKIISPNGTYRIRTYTAFLLDWLATSSDTITAMYHTPPVTAMCKPHRLNFTYEKKRTDHGGQSTMPDLNRPYFCLEDRCHSQLGEWCMSGGTNIRNSCKKSSVFLNYTNMIRPSPYPSR